MQVHPGQDGEGRDRWADRQQDAGVLVAEALVQRHYLVAGLGSILDTVSKDTEDTALSSILSVS